MNEALINYLHSVYPELEIDINYMRGYSAEEISKIERLYDIEVKGQLYDFLICMGRCSGGLFGDFPLVFYREQKTLRGSLLFQTGLREELAEIQRHDLLKQRPFFISVESYTQYYFVLTESDNPDLVYRYDENEEVVQDTGLILNDYLKSVVDTETRNYKYKAPVDYSGDLLII
ncbi:hypothetical protein CE143_03195 [Photorhabdus luminescens]|uniref:SMI1/KNR4 family protein n=1 Tax=Photorhabdus akhurstii TaxID=171438 RepID=A0ABX8M309_9GAMM|nr:hypothetical protein [Photorhabdus akhurstii]QXF36139.1 hypothetical protein B0X70_03205 [Photorhabdus akhurstii]UJD77979.1 hypothetical protein CE143_03195 [Photorhabdus luminescens]